MKILLIIFCTSIFIFSCKETPQTENHFFTSDIPTWRDNELDYYYQHNKIRLLKLDLKNIENGSDTLTIRIWYNYEVLNFREIVEIKYENLKWSGKHYAYNIDWTDNVENEKIYNLIVTEITPKSGWDYFISKLIDHRIIHLPNMDNIEGLEDGLTDGEVYNIEISTPRMYRFYSYHSPEYFNGYWQARKMVEILDFIESEIHVQTLRHKINNTATNNTLLPAGPIALLTAFS